MVTSNNITKGNTYLNVEKKKYTNVFILNSKFRKNIPRNEADNTKNKEVALPSIRKNWQHIGAKSPNWFNDP